MTQKGIPVATASTGLLIRRAKTSVLIADAIVEDLAVRRLHPGTQLATEAQLMVQYNAGRATVREAMRLLEAQGILEIRPGPTGGAFVRQPTVDHIGQLLSVLLTLQADSLHEIVDARRVLEPALAARAAERASDEQIRDLFESVDKQRAAIDDERVFLDLNEQFHTLLAEASENRALSAFQVAMRRIAVGQQIGVRYDRGSREGTLRAHTRIAEAVRARDPEMAAGKMAKHMAALQEYLVVNYPDLLSGPVRAWGRHALA